MKTTATNYLAHHDDTAHVGDLDSAPATLAECIAPVSDEERYALRKYLDRLIWEEWVPPAERVERVPSFAELDERRAERRMRRQSAAITNSAEIPADSNANTGPDAA